jgi:hypothetical protein
MLKQAKEFKELASRQCHIVVHKYTYPVHAKIRAKESIPTGLQDIHLYFLPAVMTFSTESKQRAEDTLIGQSMDVSKRKTEHPN